MKRWKDSDEWIRGDTAQRQWADTLRDRGNAVLPAYAFDDVTPETKAPVMLVPCGVRITPDVLSFRPRQFPVWHEVKAKSVPSFYRKYGRWEHGCDYSASQEYQLVQTETNIPIFIVVHETATPVDPDCHSPLEPSGIWLAISLNAALKYGEHRCDWPGGKDQPWRRGRKGMGGLLWPRGRMRLIDGGT